MRGGVGRAGRDGTQLLAPGHNHVGSTNGLENLKLMLHSWAVRWDLTPADMQGHHVPEVVTVNKVHRMCPVVAMEKKYTKWTLKGQRF